MKISKIDKILIILSFLGAALAFFIYITDRYNVTSFCPTDGCSIVAQSQYSQFFGIPVSIWGVLYFEGLSFLLLFNFKRPLKYFSYMLGTVITFGVIFTIYLRYLEFFKIGAVCPWCWGSVFIIIGIVSMFILRIRNAKKSSKASSSV
ncbi:hypothetical protein M0R04_01640 [Candidatus Dojkabacteria bacterium]|jgi:uncharacterized membrane protein|nr:hypothetical protein [Candidatus Dojkabacteria bacterium]